MLSNTRKYVLDDEKLLENRAGLQRSADSDRAYQKRMKKIKRKEKDIIETKIRKTNKQEMMRNTMVKMKMKILNYHKNLLLLLKTNGVP